MNPAERESEFMFLFDLYASSVSNMHLAKVYLQDRYGHAPGEAHDVVTYWLSNYQSLAERLGYTLESAPDDAPGPAVGKHMGPDEELELAVSSKDCATAQSALQDGARRHLENSACLWRATCNRDHRMMRILLAGGAYAGGEYLGYKLTDAAFLHDDPVGISLLTGHGAVWRDEASFLSDSLVRAVKLRRTKIARFLLKQGADPNATDASGATVLHLAAAAVCDQGRALIGVLIQFGAVPNWRDPSGASPLHLGAQSFSFSVVRRLLAAGAWVNQQDGSGRAALHYAAAEPFSHMVSIILEAGAVVNVKDECGNTPLHFAAGSRNPKNVALLMKRGARPSSRNRRGETAFDSIMHVVEFDGLVLLELLASAPRTSKARWTALLRKVIRRAALIDSAPLLVEDLLKRGADPHMLSTMDFRRLQASNQRVEGKGRPIKPEVLQALRALNRAGCVLPSELTAELL